MALAVFVMYVILAMLYESYVHPLTVLSTLPTALVGGLLTLYLVGDQASLYAFVGMFMLMGIGKKNGIMIVDFARQRVEAGESAAQAIHDASMDRFRPIIMTTLAAVIGAVPIAAGYGADGASRRPLGLVIVGGLVASQFITLYVTPVIYLYLDDFQERLPDRPALFRSGPGRPPAVRHARRRRARRAEMVGGLPGRAAPATHRGRPPAELGRAHRGRPRPAGPGAARRDARGPVPPAHGRRPGRAPAHGAIAGRSRRPVLFGVRE